MKTEKNISQKYILYNPQAGNGTCAEEAEILEVVYDHTVKIDVNRITNYKVFLSGLEDTDEVILCGGDGTLHQFVNHIRGIDLKNDLYLYAVGSGNDFARDLGMTQGDEPSDKINDVIKNLPKVTINGTERLFVNNVTFGLDCECYEKKREQQKNRKRHGRLSETASLLGEILFRWKPLNVKVMIDGKKYEYVNVWMAPVMKGRYECNGFMPAPNQERRESEGRLSLVMIHGIGKLDAFRSYMAMREGKYLKKGVTVLQGRDILVETEQPVMMQIDGEYPIIASKFHVQANTM